MKKGLIVSLTDEELADLYHIILDRDAEGALAFLDRHLKKSVQQVLEGG